MPWRRILFGVLIGGVLMLLTPVFILIILFTMLAATVQFLRELSVEMWNELPRNSLAIARAQAAFAERLPGRTVRGWHIGRRDRHKCFVQATLTGMTNPPTLWLCAVHDATGQVDELGTWQFHHGVGLRHAIRAYESSRASGDAWPTGLAELVATVPAADLPAAAKPGVHPHEGSVVVYLDGEMHFFALAEMIEDYDRGQVARAEAFDAEGRRLRMSRTAIASILVQSPFPPTPPDKVFLERLRHFLLKQTNDPLVHDRLRAMLPAELTDYGLMHAGDLPAGDPPTEEGDIE